ncbi:hypothetical protein Gotur_024068 [Gossypium turneri]
MYSLEKFEGSNSSTPRCEEESLCLCLECLRFSCISQSLGTC